MSKSTHSVLQLFNKNVRNYTLVIRYIEGSAYKVQRIETCTMYSALVVFVKPYHNLYSCTTFRLQKLIDYLISLSLHVMNHMQLSMKHY